MIQSTLALTWNGTKIRESKGVQMGKKKVPALFMSVRSYTFLPFRREQTEKMGTEGT